MNRDQNCSDVYSEVAITANRADSRHKASLIYYLFLVSFIVIFFCFSPLLTVHQFFGVRVCAVQYRIVYTWIVADSSDQMFSVKIQK